MVSTALTLLFLATTALTLALFGLAEALPRRRNTLAAYAAIAEGFVFLELAYIFTCIEWGGISPKLIALIPILGAAFAFNMAHKRFTGRTL
jgi:hypothetical protein